MSEDKARLRAAEKLRKRAEEQAGTDDVTPAEVMEPGEAKKILHQLRVHQIELEMQNEELRRAQKELEASRERYFDLYDLAPVGYFTLSKQGLILEANLTSAKLLGLERGALVQRPLAHFILFADAEIYDKHHKQLFETGAPQVFEVRLVRQDCTQFWARLEATLANGVDETPVFRGVMSNITEHKLAEAALQQAYNETAQEVESRTRELQNALNSLVRANHALGTLKECDEARAQASSEAELLNRICQIVVGIDGAKLAWVGYPEHDAEKTVQPVATAGDVDDYLKSVRITWADNAQGCGPVGSAIRTGVMSIARGTASDPILARGYASSIALPLIGEGHCFGVLTIYSERADSFNAQEVKLLQQLAVDLAIGILVLRTRVERERLQQELLKISEREKQLIAQELHDGLCQHLAGTAMMGGLLARSLEKSGSPEAPQAKKICELLNMGVDEARNLSHGLHPVKPEGEGLMEALLQYSKTTTNLFHIRCSFRCGSSVVIQSQVIATHLFRIAQEAVNNAMKHGEASRVLITLSRCLDEITLSIRDNGIGIPQHPGGSRGMGMQIMNHRATSIGATLNVKRGARSGTVVSCTLASG